MKTIEITVDVQGNSTVETKGFAGFECVEASKFVEQSLGKQLELQTTAEFFMPASTQSELKNSNSG